MLTCSDVEILKLSMYFYELSGFTHLFLLWNESIFYCLFFQSAKRYFRDEVPQRMVNGETITSPQRGLVNEVLV